MQVFHLFDQHVKPLLLDVYAGSLAQICPMCVTHGTTPVQVE